MRGRNFNIDFFESDRFLRQCLLILVMESEFFNELDFRYDWSVTNFNYNVLAVFCIEHIKKLKTINSDEIHVHILG
jgi:hypothetical protein